MNKQQLVFTGLTPKQASEHVAALMLIERVHPAGLSACFMYSDSSDEIRACIPAGVDFNFYLNAARDPERTGRMLAAAYQEQYKQLSYGEA